MTKYKLVHGGHNMGGEFHSEGSIIELKPKQARALVNKVELVQESQPEQKSAEQVEQEEVQKKQYFAALDELEVDIPKDADLDQLKKLWEDNRPQD
jgi:ribosomal protein L24